MDRKDGLISGIRKAAARAAAVLPALIHLFRMSAQASSVVSQINC